MKKSLIPYKRIVVKVGSSLLVESGTENGLGRLRKAWLATLCADIKELAAQGGEMLVVSSGAIALGRGALGLKKSGLKLEEAQAAAAAGQIELARAWSEHLGAFGLVTAQVLLTLGDTEERRRYLNARATITTLLGLNAVPVINENDTVATSEIRYGDNDRLAARVAAMIGADCLVLLSDVDGLYSAPPAQNQNAQFIEHVPVITSKTEKMAGSEGSDLSRGGMRTKIEAGRIATAAGAAMVIANGHREHALAHISDGGRATWFDAQATPARARKSWIAGHLVPKGTIMIDAGAVAALGRGKSLLPAGMMEASGGFDRGDAVVIVGPDRSEIGRGLAGFDCSEAQIIVGCRSDAIEARLGYPGRTAMVHRDDLVLTGLQVDPSEKREQDDE